MSTTFLLDSQEPPEVQRAFKAFYAFEKFLKGDAETLRNYGVKIKP